MPWALSVFGELNSDGVRAKSADSSVSVTSPQPPPATLAREAHTMAAQEQTSPAQMKSIGIGLCIAGAYGVLIGFEVLPVPGGRDALHGPLWIATLIGLVVLLAG